MPLAVQVVLSDEIAEDGLPVVCATAMSILSPCICCATASTKQEAIDRIEFNLVLIGNPFTLHIQDDCRRTPILVIVEDIPVSGVVVATAFDQDGAEICDGACCCADGALNQCLSRLPGGSYNLTIEILNPNDDDESDDDCC